MGVLGIILLVVFCIVALLLLFLITIQGQNSVGLGGIFGGNSDSAFGSGSSSFITKATTVLAIIFMVLSLVVALVNKSSDDEIQSMIKKTQTTSVEGTTWLEDQAASNYGTYYNRSSFTGVGLSFF